VRNVASDIFVQDAWRRGQSLAVHGWVYSLANGLVNDLSVTVGRPEEIERLDGGGDPKGTDTKATRPVIADPLKRV
jgi:carbonic anhydrase